MGIYKEALQYLTGSGKDERGIEASILEKYRVGLGMEKFYNEAGHISGFDSVYFPIYMPRDKKKKPKVEETLQETSTSREEQEEMEAEQYMNTEMAEYVKVKVRAAY